MRYRDVTWRIILSVSELSIDGLGQPTRWVGLGQRNWTNAQRRSDSKLFQERWTFGKYLWAAVSVWNNFEIYFTCNHARHCVTHVRTISYVTFTSVIVCLPLCILHCKRNITPTMLFTVISAIIVPYELYELSVTITNNSNTCNDSSDCVFALWARM